MWIHITARWYRLWMMKPWTCHGYNMCSKWPLSVWNQRQCACHMESNMLASTVVTAAWSFSVRSLIVLGWTAYTWPRRKKSIGLRANNWGGNAIGPQCLINLLGYVMLNQCQTLVCTISWVHQTVSFIPWQHCWEVCYPIWWWSVSKKKGHLMTCCITFFTFFNMESLWSSCMRILFRTMYIVSF